MHHLFTEEITLCYKEFFVLWWFCMCSSHWLHQAFGSYWNLINLTCNTAPSSCCDSCSVFLHFPDGKSCSCASCWKCVMLCCELNYSCSWWFFNFWGELEYQMFLYRLTKHSWLFRFVNCYLNLLTSAYPRPYPALFPSWFLILFLKTVTYWANCISFITCSIRYFAYCSIFLSVWLMDKHRNNCLLQPQYFLDVTVLNLMI